MFGGRHKSLYKNSSEYKAYDICVLTAANESQAQGYRELLQWRRDTKALPEETEFLVFSDPQGKRIGSGGSTIYVIYKLLEHFLNSCGEYKSSYELFQRKRILILHSGGDSRRLPAYSAVGKIFFPIPVANAPWRYTDTGMNEGIALFDILLNNLMQLPYLEKGHLVVASGDVLLSFDPSRVVFSDSGTTGLAYPGHLEVASKHGVYVPSQKQPQLESNLRKVADFLQKPTYDELVRCGGLDTADRAFIDTGIMNFSLDAMQTLMKSSGISIENGKVGSEKDGLYDDLASAKIYLDIYKEIPFAMLGKDIQVGDVEGQSVGSLTALEQTPFFVNLLPYCEFFHIGMSKQLLQSFHTISYTASAYDFQNYSKSKVIDRSGIENVFVYNSLINTHPVRANGPSLIEGCYLEGQIQLEGHNILTGIPKNTGDIKLQNGICAFCIPVNANEARDTWASVIYGINDDFKKLAEDSDASFLNGDPLDWMKAKGILPCDLWVEDEAHELWNARLFPSAAKPSESMRIALGLQMEASLSTVHRKSPEFCLDEWRRAKRMSLQELLQRVDYKRLFHKCSDLYREVNLASFAGTLKVGGNLSSDEILSWCLRTDDYEMAAETVSNLLENTTEILLQSRLYKLLSNILRKAHESSPEQNDGKGVSDEIVGKISSLPRLKESISTGGQDIHSEFLTNSLDNIAFELIREAIGKGLKRKEDCNPTIQIRSDEVVWVCAPARLDFGGGWSDTPPYCLEHGGSVLNAAVKLNGQYPIQVVGKLHPEPSVKINSIDLGERVVVSEISEMLSYQDPTDWLSLPKSAFVGSGIIPENTERSLADILGELGSGIDLTLFSAVPAGSGLGTSSIMASAIIACLSRIIGQELAQTELFNRTLYVEQLMTTGGGWQDQVGGVVGGVKHIQTDPGLFQIPRISWTDLKAKSNADIFDRLLLYYTGHRRMAKNILRSIVGKYLDRDPVVIDIIAQLREKSLEMKSELDYRNIDAFGEKIAEVWRLNKALDPGSSNENIEAILDKISHLICGAKLLGAGGGGFLFMVTIGPEETCEVKRILTEDPPNPRSRFFDFEVDRAGLKVTVL